MSVCLCFVSMCPVCVSMCLSACLCESLRFNVPFLITTKLLTYTLCSPELVLSYV